MSKVTRDLFSGSDVLELQVSATVTSTQDSAEDDLTDYTGNVIVILNSALGTGTTPTLDCKVQDATTSGGSFADVSGAVFTQVTDGAKSFQILRLDADASRGFIKIVETIAGGGGGDCSSVPSDTWTTSSSW